jgi:hypothetical protein
MDTIILIVIVTNAFFLGISIDNPQHDDIWLIVDIGFTACFITEVALKTFTNGFKEEFCGKEKFANLFDVMLIVLDLIQLIFKLNDTDVEGPSVSLFRMIRLGRFLRIIRLCRTEKFKDLLGMIQGMLGAMLTLAWAIVLFGMLLYVAALLCRELLGTKEKENISEYFDTVPRSMFTVFRCSFGDCSTSGGVPIFEYVTEAYGGVYAFAYCMFVFLMTIGLFNVISAIFVDSTMAAAATLNEKKRQDRLADERLWSTNTAVLIRRVLSLCPQYNIPSGKLSSAIDSILHIQISRTIMEEAVEDPVARNALDRLDIDPHDHDKLAEILDPDHTGTMTVLDIVNGLRQLRGEPRRSDIVSVALMIRSLQDMVEEIFFWVKDARRAGS